MTTLLELTADQKLLSPNFTGYHLSLDPLPVQRLEIPSGVDKINPAEDQYSFLHAKVFGLHNHLFADPWHPETVYFFDSNWSIQGTVEEFGRVANFQKLWDVPSTKDRTTRDYNLTLSFPSFDLCVVSDGAGDIYVLNTGDRSHLLDEWQVVFTGEVPGVAGSSVLLDSRLLPDDAMLGETVKPEQLHCLILDINEKADSESGDGDGSKFISTVNWVTFAMEDEKWVPKPTVSLTSLGAVDYAALEEGCKAVYIASNKPFDFASKLDTDEKSDTEDEVSASVPCPFSWMQTADDVTVSIKVPEHTARSEVTVTVTPMFTNVTVKGQVLLDGFFPNRVDADLTTWSIKNDKLEMVLCKQESGLSWRELIRGDPRGQVLDPAYVEEVHNRLAHLCSEAEEAGGSGNLGMSSEQSEECDEAPEDTSVFLRLDVDKRKATHKASLSSNRWLFNNRVSGAQATPAICLRHDVDACVWQPSKLVDSTAIWPVRHIGTFNAFGYVQASKIRRRFTVCAPDMSYVAICETSRHVYIYRQPNPVVGDLRCRTTGEKVKKIARQQVFQLDPASQVLGCHASCENVFVLTTTTLHVIGVTI